MSFRSSQHCKRYEYVSVKLDNPIELPANNNNQDKDGYKFTVDIAVHIAVHIVHIAVLRWIGITLSLSWT